MTLLYRVPQNKIKIPLSHGVMTDLIDTTSINIFLQLQ